LIGGEHLAKQLMALPFRRRDQQDERAGRRQELVERDGGDGGRFAGLAGAVEQEIGFARPEQIALPGIRREVLSVQDKRRVKQQSEGALRVHIR
jgi:hypothetical protein